MNPSAARQLLLEMDNTLNSRLQEIVEYGEALRENSNALERRIDQIDRIIFWIIAFGIPGLVLLLIVAAHH